MKKENNFNKKESEKEKQDKILKMINEGIDYANPTKTWKGINLLVDDVKEKTRKKILDKIEVKIKDFLYCDVLGGDKDLKIEHDDLLKVIEKLRDRE